MTGGNTTNIVLKGMQRYFLTTPPLKKILQFQERICLFFLKTQKTTSSASVWWGNSKSSFKENARTLSKSSPLMKVEFQNQKKDYEICTKRKFRTKNQTNDWKLTKWTLSIRKQTSKRC